MTEPEKPTTTVTTPSFAQKLNTYISTAMTRDFGIALAQYLPSTWGTSPAAEAIGWDSSTADLTKTASKFATEDQRALATAKAVVKQADEAEQNGMKDSNPGGILHVVNTGERRHGYLYHTWWTQLSDTAWETLKTRNNPNVFRAMPWCFASFVGELPKGPTPPPTITWQPSGPEGSGFELDTSAQEKSIVAHGTSQWSTLSPISGLIQLGLSSVICARFYRELYDQESGLLLRWCRFGTTGFHVFDGYLNWMSITDTKKQRAMFACVGGGSHPVPGMDAVNPIGGAIALSVMWRSYAHLLNSGFNGKQMGILPVGRIGPRDVTAFIAQTDKRLAQQRRLLADADQPAVGIAIVRELLGPNTKDEDL